jgi:hypothetical protein
MPKPSDDQLSPRYTDAIGRLVVAVSKIDILLTDLAAALLRVRPIWAVATVHHQQMANKIDTLRTLVKLRDWPEGDPEILKLLSKVKEVNNYRNRVVHGYWTVDKAGETYVVKFETRGEFKRPRVAVTPQEILSKAQQADELADELGTVRDRLWDEASADLIVDGVELELAKSGKKKHERTD